MSSSIHSPRGGFLRLVPFPAAPKWQRFLTDKMGRLIGRPGWSELDEKYVFKGGNSKIAPESMEVGVWQNGLITPFGQSDVPEGYF